MLYVNFLRVCRIYMFPKRSSAATSSCVCERAGGGGGAAPTDGCRRNVERRAEALNGADENPLPVCNQQCVLMQTYVFSAVANNIPGLFAANKVLWLVPISLTLASWEYRCCVIECVREGSERERKQNSIWD